jgi:hypothetical protein
MIATLLLSATWTQTAYRVPATPTAPGFVIALAFGWAPVAGKPRMFACGAARLCVKSQTVTRGALVNALAIHAGEPKRVMVGRSAAWSVYSGPPVRTAGVAISAFAYVPDVFFSCQATLPAGTKPCGCEDVQDMIRSIQPLPP